MLTRLKVTGFKNLVDVDVRFGPFTCVAGPNGVGKSNLFDAISLLSALADHTLVDAALSIRDVGRRTADVRSLFHHSGDRFDNEMSFEAELIIPKRGIDDLGQEAQATTTFLRYTVKLRCRKEPTFFDGQISFRGDETFGGLAPLELVHEELVHIPLGQAYEQLRFPHKPSWRKSAVAGRRSGTEFISTDEESGVRVVKLHQDRGGGRPLSRAAGSLPRTILSSTNAAESPTALLVRREMQSWRMLQLEPSALRRPDELTSPSRMEYNGSHMPATLYRLARTQSPQGGGRRVLSGNGNGDVYVHTANRLAELINDVREIGIDRDERRELLTLFAVDRDGTWHAARSLSDGTLRFLALVVLEQDPEVQGLVCLEEPENGINVARIPAMIRLLMDIAVDADEPVGDDNPLRQVIVNTHSPAVVLQVPEECLLVGVAENSVQNGVRYQRVNFRHLAGTWRDKKGTNGFGNTCSRGELLSALDLVKRDEYPAKPVRVFDVLQLSLFPESH